MAEMMLLANWLRRWSVGTAAKLLTLATIAIISIASAQAQNLGRIRSAAPQAAPLPLQESAPSLGGADTKRPNNPSAQKTESGAALRAMIGQMILIGFPGQKASEERSEEHTSELQS